ncbi:MAG: hypothetical protein CVU95_08405 [Firmicutes bacterium HGW-Firmicutes-2]|jgi:hypothetical protein|nr:MAG: hypothetical protein CVU95_08405 [Firmicutes bacterium HGW-Firmicutes-2]
MAWIGAEKLFNTDVNAEAAREEKTNLRPLHKLRAEKECCGNCGYRRKEMCKPFRRPITSMTYKCAMHSYDYRNENENDYQEEGEKNAK